MSPNILLQADDTNEISLAALERRLMKAYLLEKGFTLADLRKMTLEERKQLMREACLYASVRLANIEAISKFRKKIGKPRI